MVAAAGNYHINQRTSARSDIDPQNGFKYNSKFNTSRAESILHVVYC